MIPGDDEGATPSSQRADWRFLIDENLNPDIASELATDDIQAEHLLEVLFEGADDWTPT